MSFFLTPYLSRDCPDPVDGCTGTFEERDNLDTMALFSRYLSGVAAFNGIPGVCTVIADPRARFLQVMGIRIPAQRTGNPFTGTSFLSDSFHKDPA
jgi:hypothetical protein